MKSKAAQHGQRGGISRVSLGQLRLGAQHNLLGARRNEEKKEKGLSPKASSPLFKAQDPVGLIDFGTRKAQDLLGPLLRTPESPSLHRNPASPIRSLAE
jgi:hypothetical protein